MKTKHALIILTIGILLYYIAALFKIQHWPGGNLLMIVSTTMKVIGGLLLLYKLLTHPKVKEFLN